MTNEPRHRRTGETLSEVIAQHPNELPYDAVALMHIVPTGRVNFGLTGDALTDYVRRSVRALLEAGAVPVTHIPGNGYEFTYETKYGSTIDEITEGVVKEWLTLPDDPLVLAGEGAWFARPDPKFPKYVKLD
ncbi:MULTISPECIES: hypothetical protein [unclassified Hyphomicrobium]|uniref:hypothetical protein n=1 Tax=unclassified Hyphomicrobium TaxID=2619925 RepID=UPI000213D369|nr:MULTISPECIES: hypothetical protein [unclassified Hyphomicrobium]CCB65614.1 putative integron gene cassette protein [Hyphomicrobium sp. MC1]